MKVCPFGLLACEGSCCNVFLLDFKKMCFKLAVIIANCLIGVGFFCVIFKGKFFKSLVTCWRVYFLHRCIWLFFFFIYRVITFHIKSKWNMYFLTFHPFLFSFFNNWFHVYMFFNIFYNSEFWISVRLWLFAGKCSSNDVKLFWFRNLILCL